MIMHNFLQTTKMNFVIAKNMASKRGIALHHQQTMTIAKGPQGQHD